MTAGEYLRDIINKLPVDVNLCFDPKPNNNQVYIMLSNYVTSVKTNDLSDLFPVYGIVWKDFYIHHIMNKEYMDYEVEHFVDSLNEKFDYEHN